MYASASHVVPSSEVSNQRIRHLLFPPTRSTCTVPFVTTWSCQRRRRKYNNQIASIGWPLQLVRNIYRHLLQYGSRGSFVTEHTLIFYMCPVGTGVSFPEVERSGCYADHLPPPNTEVKNAWNSSSTPPYIMARYWVKHGQIYLYFTLTVCEVTHKSKRRNVIA
jgi:hypothetical protein